MKHLKDRPLTGRAELDQILVQLPHPLLKEDMNKFEVKGPYNNTSSKLDDLPPQERYAFYRDYCDIDNFLTKDNYYYDFVRFCTEYQITEYYERIIDITCRKTKEFITKIARQNKCLDYLATSKNFNCRMVALENGYDPNFFIKDASSKVRKLALERGDNPYLWLDDKDKDIAARAKELIHFRK